MLSGLFIKDPSGLRAFTGDPMNREDRRMKVAEIMTRDVITVAPEAPVHAAARLMVDHGISALPVVAGDGAVVGLVSEGDLIVREKPRESAAWWKLFFQDSERLAREYTKAHGTSVAEIMSKPVVHVAPDAPIGAAAAIMDELRIKRLPVLADGRLIGIVSRADLIKALALAPIAKPALPLDQELEREMRARLEEEPWVSNRRLVVRAENSVLSLFGMVSTDAERAALETMARSIEGCAGVENNLIVADRVPRLAHL
jgi:CBS-domain-containing membrane protein